MMTPPLTDKFEVIHEECNDSFVDAAAIAEKSGLPEFHVHQQMANLGFHPSAYVVDLTKVWGFKRVYKDTQLQALVKKLFDIVKREERVVLLNKLIARLQNEAN